MHSEDFPLVSIVTVHFNSPEVTLDFLRSISDQNTYPNIEVIIIDNASVEDNGADFMRIFPGLNFIRNPTNLGFAGGNNTGIRVAKGDYIFLVNNDTEFTPHLIEGLLDVFLKHPDAGIVSPKFQYFFHKGTIEYAGYHRVNIFTGRNSMVGCREQDEGQYNQLMETAYPHGGAMMVPRKVIAEAGMLPEIYFLYYEEFDWSEHICHKGYKVYYQPASLIYHKESMSTGKTSPLKTYYLSRNRILFMRRNMTGFQFFLFSIYLSLITIPKNTLKYLIEGKADHLAAFWKGILWHFNNRVIYPKN